MPTYTRKRSVPKGTPPICQRSHFPPPRTLGLVGTLSPWHREYQARCHGSRPMSRACPDRYPSKPQEISTTTLLANFREFTFRNCLEKSCRLLKGASLATGSGRSSLLGDPRSPDSALTPIFQTVSPRTPVNKASGKGHSPVGLDPSRSPHPCRRVLLLSSELRMQPLPEALRDGLEQCIKFRDPVGHSLAVGCNHIFPVGEHSVEAAAATD